MPELSPQLMILLIIIFFAVITDLKTRKIYNWLTFPGMILGIILNTLLYNEVDKLSGFLFSIQGLMLGILIFFIPFALGGLGAGDIKLLGVVGAFGGLKFVLWSGLYGAIVGGSIALIIILFDKTKLKAIGQFFKNLFFSIFYKTKIFKPSAENISGRRFPYSIAIFLGVIFTIILKP